MTTHDRKVIAAAKEAGISHNTWDHQDNEAVMTFYAIAFEAGRVAEREECAKVCESTYPKYGGYNPFCFETPVECAEAIRARGDTK